jgi:hypothetical protein
MKPSRKLLRRWTALAGTLILAAGAVPMALAAGHEAAPLRVVGMTVGGAGVEIEILNPGPERQTGTVTVRVRLGNRVETVAASVAIPGGQKVFVLVPPPAPGRRLVPMGVILDDGTPF